MGAEEGGESGCESRWRVAEYTQVCRMRSFRARTLSGRAPGPCRRRTPGRAPSTLSAACSTYGYLILDLFKVVTSKVVKTRIFVTGRILLYQDFNYSRIQTRSKSLFFLKRPVVLNNNVFVSGNIIRRPLVGQVGEGA